jgi:aspartyl-tRNA(Asn)/glutamyl-tRNA(Gln) amidotransferase subunit A
MKSPVHGAPYGLKDCIETAGLRTTGHSRLFLDHVPTRSATIAQRLEDAGAVLLGKHSMYELSYGGPSFDLPFPPARNPWDLGRIPGGSSSGTAATIAAGLCPGGIGTDAGGSIRQPASFCGIAGLKPTRGLVPHDGIIRIAPSLGEAGPMAWTAEDCSLLLDVIAGTRTRVGIGLDIAGLRIGVARAFFTDTVHPEAEVVAAFDRSIGILERLGCRPCSVELPSLRDVDAIGRVILLAESYATWEARLQEDPSVFGRIGRHRFMLGAYLSAADYIQALRGRERVRRAVSALFDHVDVLVTAGERSGAPTFAEAGESFPFVAEPSLRMPFTVSGHPALVVRCGFDRRGLPLGLQLVGRHGADDLVLALGHAFEQQAGLLERRPVL